MVSPERIYQFIRKDKANGRDLYKHLRHKLKRRKKKSNKDYKIKIKDRVSIEHRDEIINQRKEFGHWEADLIVGKKQQGYALVITERLSKQVFTAHLPKGKKAPEVSKTLIDLLLPYKKWVRSITFDNGTEFADQMTVAEKFEAKTFFTHPYSSWEKGQVENMNKLLRQYILKNEPINEDTMQNIKEIQYKINRRPRKNLNYEKPFEKFHNFVNSKVAFDS